MLQNIVKIYIGIVLILLKKESVVFVVGAAVQKEKPIIPVNKSPHLKILADWQSHTNLVDASRKKGPSNRSPLKGNHKTENDSRSVHFFCLYVLTAFDCIMSYSFWFPFDDNKNITHWTLKPLLWQILSDKIDRNALKRIHVCACVRLNVCICA